MHLIFRRRPLQPTVACIHSSQNTAFRWCKHRAGRLNCDFQLGRNAWIQNLHLVRTGFDSSIADNRLASLTCLNYIGHVRLPHKHDVLTSTRVIGLWTLLLSCSSSRTVRYNFSLPVVYSTVVHRPLTSIQSPLAVQPFMQQPESPPQVQPRRTGTSLLSTSSRFASRHASESSESF